MSQNKQQQSKTKRPQTEGEKLYIKYSFYQMVSLIFLIVGVIVVAFLYHTQYNGSVLDMLQTPKAPIIILIAFMPSAILSYIANKTRQQLEQLHNKGNVAKDSDKNAKKK